MSDNKTPSGPTKSGRPLVVTAVVAALVAGGVGYALGRRGTGGPLDGRPSGGAVVARFDGERITVAEIERLIAAQPEAERARLADPGERTRFVEAWARALLFARLSERKGFHRDPEFVGRYARELAGFYVERVWEAPTRERKVPDEELKGWFDAHQAELQRPERVRLALVTFDAPDPAAKAKKLGAARATLAEAKQRPLDPYAFGTLARLRSEDVRTRALNGELPPMSREELAAAFGPELASAVWELKEPGAILPRVVETARALHVVKLVAREPEDRVAFEAVKELLRQRVLAERLARGRKELAESAAKDAGLRIDEGAVAGMAAAGGTRR